MRVQNNSMIVSGRSALSSGMTAKTMSKTITYLIGISLASMLVIWVYSGSLWSDFYGTEKANPSNMTHPHLKDNDQPVNKKPRGTGGLYETNPYVTEIYTSSELDSYKVHEKNLMVVFYASWCGHCRNFAPKFTAVAQKVTLRTNELNEENPMALYPKTNFLAVNCVTLRNVCDSHKVEYYPAIQVFNFVNTDAKTKTKMEGIDTELLKFFGKTIFLHGELEKKSSAAKSKVVPLVVNNNAKLSHLTDKAEDRIHDALSSLLFFLMNELPEELNQERVASLLSTIDMILTMIPLPSEVPKPLSEQLIFSQSVLSHVKVVLYKYSKSSFLPRKKIMEALSSAMTAYKRPVEAFPPKVEWRICGVPASSVSTLRGSKQQVNTDPGTAYSCGLWLLFHYMTLQGEVVYAAKNASILAQNITALSIMNGIHGFVENFFGCKECRAHFLQYYNLQLFGRNLIQKDDDFPNLQIWLFQLHNLVTSRIRLEKSFGALVHRNHSDSAILSPRDWQKYQDTIVSSFWPTRKQCSHCYTGDSLMTLDYNKVENWEDIIRPVVEHSFKLQAGADYMKKAFLV